MMFARPSRRVAPVRLRHPGRRARRGSTRRREGWIQRSGKARAARQIRSASWARPRHAPWSWARSRGNLERGIRSVAMHLPSFPHQPRASVARRNRRGEAALLQPPWADRHVNAEPRDRDGRTHGTTYHPHRRKSDPFRLVAAEQQTATTVDQGNARPPPPTARLAGKPANRRPGADRRCGLVRTPTIRRTAAEMRARRAPTGPDGRVSPVANETNQR